MTRTTSEKIRLGIFVVTGTVLLVVAAYLIGNNQNIFDKTFTISAVFSNVNGLQPGNNVRFSGIHVGTVKGIHMEQDTVIRVDMAIEQKMQPYIKKDAIATIGSDGLVGNMIVNIIPGKYMSPPVNEGDEITSYSRIGTEDMLSTLNVTNENAAILTADLLKVTRSLVQGKGTLGRLLNDTVMAEDLYKTIRNLKVASRDAQTTLRELNKFVEGMNSEQSVAGILLKDSLYGQKVKTIIDHLETSGASISHMSDSLQYMVNRLSKGEGALHFLTTDTLFVRSLQNTMKNVEEGTARFNTNMEAMRENFLFRRYFRKLEKEQKKSQKE
ncbi:MlaD family protein [Ascidiimonas aurantiaca]|uniref:MlaD family protein n=1 Tax=Ascidiimonas aurantiaca TaxID=1685432 RepID=UPI0030EF24F4